VPTASLTKSCDKIDAIPGELQQGTGSTGSADRKPDEELHVRHERRSVYHLFDGQVMLAGVWLLRQLDIRCPGDPLLLDGEGERLASELMSASCHEETLRCPLPK
jgi:hypothetical protein